MIRRTLALVAIAVLPFAAAAQERLAGESSIIVLPGAYAPEVTTANITFHVTGAFISGLAKDARMVLRQRIETVQVIDEKGAVSTTVTTDAWQLGDALDEAPRWTVTAPGDGAELSWEGLYWVWAENTDWPYPPKTAYRLADGARLLVTTLPWVTAQTETDGVRLFAYAAGQAFEVDAEVAGRPRAVGVITYAKADAVMQRVLVEADTEQRMVELGAVEETPALTVRDAAGAPLQPYAMIDPAGASGLGVTVDYPFNGVTLAIPVIDDRLALDQATVPAGLSLVPLP